MDSETRRFLEGVEQRLGERLDGVEQRLGERLDVAARERAEMLEAIMRLSLAPGSVATLEETRKKNGR